MELKKNLGYFSVFCIASGAMISSGLFILPGMAFSQAGPGVIISYFLAGLLSLPGMLSLTEMVTAMPKAGGDCFTIMRSLGPAVGTVAGLLSWFSLAMKSAFALVGMSIFTIILVKIDIHIIAVFFCFLFLLINIMGVKEAALFQTIIVMGLFGLMMIYIFTGWGSIQIQRFSNFFHKGIPALLSTAGLVFVSYAGLLKIASIAEEIKNPGKTIPRAMLTSLVIVMVFYGLMVLITMGVLNAQTLRFSQKPISDGALSFLGKPGEIIMSIAAIFAFLSTANAGMMTAARSLVPLSRDNLFPGIFGRINNKTGTPINALLITAFFIILSLFLQFKILVEAASLVLIVTNILTCISVIILRESKIQNYRPQFKTPFYPWLQISGIVLLILLILQMGLEAIIISLVLVLAGILTYWLYGRIKGYREYALLHLIEKITAKELTSHSLEEELKNILRERDHLVNDRFDNIVNSAVLLDLDEKMDVTLFFKKAGELLSQKIKLSENEIYTLLNQREKESTTAISPFIAVPHIVIKPEHNFSLLIARNRKGIFFSENNPHVKAVFILAGSKSDRTFHLQCLSAIAQIIQEDDFEKRWMNAKNIEVMRDIILLGKRKRLQ